MWHTEGDTASSDSAHFGEVFVKGAHSSFYTSHGKAQYRADCASTMPTA